MTNNEIRYESIDIKIPPDPNTWKPTGTFLDKTHYILKEDFSSSINSHEKEIIICAHGIGMSYYL